MGINIEEVLITLFITIGILVFLHVTWYNKVILLSLRVKIKEFIQYRKDKIIELTEKLTGEEK